MAEFPSLPVWTDALLGDTQHLNTEQFGAYLLMLIVAWRSPDNALPTDDHQLATITRLSRAKWLKTKTVLLAFWREDSGRYRQKNLDKVKNSVRETAQKNRENATNRWLKNKDSGNASAMPNGMPERCQNDALQNQNQIEEGKPLSEASPVGGGFGFDDAGGVGLKNNIEEVKPEKKSKPSYDADFEAMWALWKPFDMDKGSKFEANKSYNKARERTDHETIIRGVAAYCAFSAARRSKTKHVVTWLNQRGWADEYPVVKPQDETPQTRTAYGDSVENAARLVRLKIDRDRQIRTQDD